MITNRPSSKKHYFPYFLDLVEDNVRNRCLFPLVALALYVLLVITIMSSESAVSFFNFIALSMNKTKIDCTATFTNKIPTPISRFICD